MYYHNLKGSGWDKVFSIRAEKEVFIGLSWIEIQNPEIEYTSI